MYVCNMYTLVLEEGNKTTDQCSFGIVGSGTGTKFFFIFQMILSFVTSYENIILNTTHKQHKLCRKTIHLLKHNTCQYIKFLFHIPRPLVTGEKLSKLNEKKVKMPIYHDKKQYLTVMHEDIMEYTSIQKTSRLICMIYFFK